jgi:benzylsuccinate CoA-transferase BbsF subunit
MVLPLEDVKVLDFMWVMAGPAAVRYLADYGATVVHVESATRIDTARTLQPMRDKQAGPDRSGVFANLNAGKLSLALNLAKPAAKDVIFRLVRWADIVTESYSPRAMRNWSLGYETLREVNPGIVMLSSCLNGQTGPWAALAGFGTMGAQLAGFGELAGWPDRPPAGPFGAYTDYIAPKFTVMALLAALDHRRRTGEGQYIDFSQAEASQQFLGTALLDYTVNNHVQSRTGNRSSAAAPHAVFPAAGVDRWVAIAAETEAQWQALCAAVGRTDWLTRPDCTSAAGRQAHREELEQGIAEWTSSRTVEDIEAILQSARVPVHRVSDSRDLLADPHLAARGHFVQVQHAEAGVAPLESSRMRLSRTPAIPPGPAPTIGQHTDHVLREILGMGDEEIIDLVAAGALE